MFAVKIKRKALRKLEKLSAKRKQYIKTVILILKTDPIPFKKVDICKLQGHDNTYRIRVGNLRIVYQVLWNEKTTLIHYIEPERKPTYNKGLGGYIVWQN
ncbi:MAG: type II toxin-antitoxin system RelE/ParE family toxin [Candidatus Bathyarchaeia archaeon]